MSMSYDTNEKNKLSKFDIQLDIPESLRSEFTTEKMMHRFDDAGEPFSGIFLFLVAILNNVLADIRDIKEQLEELQKKT